MLADQLPASDAEAAQQAEAQATALRRQIARAETAEQALMTELETLGTDTSPATTAYRTRIRERFTQLYNQRTQAETELAALTATTPDTPDPTLLDELPYAAAHLAEAPDHIRERLYAALDIQALYRHDKKQVTIWATITDATPHAIRQLLTDPRTDNDTTTPAHPGPFAKFGELPPAPMMTVPTDIRGGRTFEGGCAARFRVVKIPPSRDRKVAQGSQSGTATISIAFRDSVRRSFLF
jgi:hypothetical protein